MLVKSTLGGKIPEYSPRECPGLKGSTHSVTGGAQSCGCAECCFNHSICIHL